MVKAWSPSHHLPYCFPHFLKTPVLCDKDANSIIPLWKGIIGQTYEGKKDILEAAKGLFELISCS